MKDELGIEIKCENCCECANRHYGQRGVCKDMGGEGTLDERNFEPDFIALKARILELQFERDKFKAFVEKVANDDKETERWIQTGELIDEARALLRGESEAGK